MLNKVSVTSSADASRPGKARMAAQDRRRQLIGIGLTMLTHKQVHQVSVDEVATEAGISRGLLFHYFDTKADYYSALVESAGRRVLRNTAPDDASAPREQLTQMVAGFIDQIDRRRGLYISLVRGAGGGGGKVVEVYDLLREEMTQRVIGSLSLAPGRREVVHAWWAYVEDVAIEWSGQPDDRRTRSLTRVVEHCACALEALLELG